MIKETRDTLPRASKGPIAPAPSLPKGNIATVAKAVGSWAGVVSTAHWDLYDSSRVDGIDFYVGEDELGHIHLDGSIHLATDPELGKLLVTEGLARRFPYARGWVEQQVDNLGAPQTIELFRRNYQRLNRPVASQ